MGKIFVGQTKLQLDAFLGQDITGVSNALIKYKKPDDTQGEFTATIVDESTGHIRYDVQAITDIDQAGEWTFWGHITYTDGKVVPGEAHTETVFMEGS